MDSVKFPGRVVCNRPSGHRNAPHPKSLGTLIEEWGQRPEVHGWRALYQKVFKANRHFPKWLIVEVPNSHDAVW